MLQSINEIDNVVPSVNAHDYFGSNNHGEDDLQNSYDSLDQRIDVATNGYNEEPDDTQQSQIPFEGSDESVGEDPGAS